MKFEVVTTPYGSFPASFACSKLAEICVPDEGIQTGPFGSQLHQKDYVNDGTPIITVEHLGENRIIHRDLPRVSDEDRERLSRYKLQVGDIVFSRVGSVDRRALVREEEDGWLFSGRCLRVRPNTKLIDTHYLSWFFGLSGFKEYIRGIAVGATMPSLNTDILSNVPIYYPPLDKQQNTAAILDSVDGKIALNEEMNKTLEAMGQALFKDWFIDFEFPNEKGKPYKLNGGKMVDSELGEIPEGWRVAVLPEVSLVVDCLHTKKPEMIQEGRLLLQVYNIATDGTLDFTEKYPVSEGDYQEWIRNIEVKEGDCLITNAGRVGAVGQVPMGFKGGIGRNITAIRPVGVTPAYLFRYLFSSYGLGEIRRQTDQGTVLDSLNVKGVKKIRILIPLRAVIGGFEEIARPLREKVERNKSENDCLVGIRDSLLPRLMSGKIRVNLEVPS
jgi:type I restriction enzyme, S subunit